MFSLEKYLERIGYAGPVEPTLETLRGLSRSAMLAVPFEFLDYLGEEGERFLDLGTDRLFEKVVTQHGGGGCFENNALFAEVLKEIGFEATVLGSYMWRPHFNEYSKVYGHMLLMVTLDGAPWLVDSSFSHATFSEPIRFAAGEVQEQRGWKYEIRPEEHIAEEGAAPQDAFVVYRAGASGKWMPLYKFVPEPAKLADFEESGNYLASPERKSHLLDTVLWARTLPEGNITLMDQILITATPGMERIRKVTDLAEAFEVIDEIFDGHPQLAARGKAVWEKRFGTPTESEQVVATDVNEVATW
jgi:arylamine N-acetyltransferase